MPVYNAEKYLKESVSSILNQTFRYFEFLIMDDGSNDHSPEILKNFAAQDKRISLFHQTNQGIAKSLNILIDKANTDIIARMDADDIAHRERFKIQYEYLLKHPKTVLLGSFGEFFEGEKILGNNIAFEEDFMNRWFLSLFPPFLHGTAMIRKKILLKVGKYRPEKEPVEDYDLWVRIKRFGNIENIPKILTELRVTSESVSAKNFRKQLQKRDEIGLINLEDIYRNNEIPLIEKIIKTLKKYKLDYHKKYAIGKLCCLTGCFLIQKREYKRAVQFLKFCLHLDKKRMLDAFINLFIGRLGKAYLISADYSPYTKKMTFKIRWFSAY